MIRLACLHVLVTPMKKARDLWHPLPPDSLYTDHEFRVERRAQSAEHTQAHVNFFRRLLGLPIRRTQAEAGNAVRRQYVNPSLGLSTQEVDARLAEIRRAYSLKE